MRREPNAVDARADWRELPFPDAIDFQEGPGILAKDFRLAGVPLVRLKGLDPGNRLLAGCNFLDPDEVGRRWGHFRLKVGDVLLSTSASLGRTAIVDPVTVGAIPYTGLIRMRPRSLDLDARFLPFLLRSPHFQRQVEAIGAGSVIRHFGPTHLRHMTVRFPSITQQRAIASILGALDDKIELNRRTNETLEGIARALFQSWFVDFDPVRAKMAGRKPVGMDAETAKLFPSELVDSDLGPIPRGWSVSQLDSIAHFLNGLALQKYPPTQSASLPVLKIADLRRGNTIGSDRASAEIPAEYVIKDGDLVFSWSGSLEVVIWCGGPCALNQHLFKVTSETLPIWFVHRALLLHLSEFRRIAADKATTMGHIKRGHLTEAGVVVPPTNLISMAAPTFASLHAQMIASSLESRTLATLRDTLLPKLLSGELRVPEAERAVSAAL